MSREGGRHVGLPTLTLITALVAANLAMLALNLHKHDRLPFVSSGGEAAAVDSGPDSDSASEPAGDTPGSGTDEVDGIAAASTVVDLDPVEIGDSPSVGAPSGDWLPNEALFDPALLDPALFEDVVLLHEAGQVGLPADRPAALDEIAAVAAKDRRAGISVVAHIDDFGDSDANAAVAFARASAVVDYLKSLGVDRSQTIVAIPPANPDAAPNESEDARRFNRRVEVKLLFGSSAGGAIGGAGSDGTGSDGTDSDGTGSDGSDSDGSDSGGTEIEDGRVVAVDERWSIDGALAAGFDCARPVVGQPFRVGYAVDLGSGTAADEPGSEAARHLARMVNCSGGVEGRPMEVLVVDVSGTVLGSRPAIEELLAWQPDVIIGPSVAGTALRLRGAVAGRVPMVFPLSSEPALANLALASFTVLPVEQGGGVAAARFAIDQGWTRAILVGSSDEGYRTEAAWFSETFVVGGGVVVAVVTPGGVPVGLSGIDTPGVVFAAMAAEAFNELQREVASTSAEAVSDEVAFLNSDPTAVYDAEAEFGVRSYGVTPVLTDQDGRAARLDESFAAANGSRSTNPVAAALVGDAFAVAVNAYLEGGGGDAQATSQAVATGLTVQGLTGVLSYRDGFGAPSRPMYVVQQFDGGIGAVATIEP